MEQKRALFAVLMIALTIGQITEIKTQSVPLYDYIKQYAVVEIKDGSTVTNKYCEDCACTLTVKEDLGRTLFSDKPTELLSIGLYGYRATPAEFIVSKSYNAQFYCISPVYGNGTVYSRITILPSDAIQPSGAITDAVTDLLPSLDLGLGDFATNIKDGIIDGLRAVFPDLSDLNLPGFDTITNVLGSVVRAFKAVASGFIMLFTDPVEGWNKLISLMFTLFTPLIIVFAVPFILYEFYIITLILEQPFDQFIKNFFIHQFDIVKVFVAFFLFVRDTASTIYFMVTDGIKALTTWIP